MTIYILPSILAADFANLGAAVRDAEAGGAVAVHIDVMDGHFVPNITIGAPVVAALRKVTTLTLDVHLMIENPGNFVEAFAKAGADTLTVHVEACPHLHRVIQQIRQAGMQPGVALNPATPLAAIEEIVGEVGLVLLMPVTPGFGGQTFLPSVLPKVRRLREMLTARGLDNVALEVDGGVDEESAPLLAAAGAALLVAGSAIYAPGADVAARITHLRACAEAGQTSGQ